MNEADINPYGAGSGSVNKSGSALKLKPKNAILNL
jgi:hypothetical protein